ncbi:MAG: DUF3536 domain-containing protein [Desulfomonile tiedjei]|nr:DUF3536 domain-containing protein [Desulfomonile tiedjei]
MNPPIPRYICIHGHFYQPPRENPWLEYIETQESAHPFHDWNERVAYECYTPNAHARILDEQGLLRLIINNYEYLSFDFGPTLMSWLENFAPETYHAIIEADAVSQTRRSGHGNAIALAYNHMIMPLASTRDKISQIVWGMEDFRKRFSRDPEGMWLPEAAVDKETLEILVQHGVRFTILAPKQAGRFRDSSKDQWITLNPGSIDPSRPYVCNLSEGRSIVLFFYDGPISQAIAFEKLLQSGEELRSRLLGAFSPGRTWPQLVNIATDGESFGHHHRFGEMALAFALERLLADPTVRITNYGEYLEKHPPTAEVEFIENSAWSCAHGVGRWSTDCGCSVAPKPGWNQKWRAPLRQSLDLLRDRVDRLYEKKASGFLKDPWAARDAYIDVLLGERSNIPGFLTMYASRKLHIHEREMVLKLLEMQRNRMLMYTSCGWFFDDISGIESMQVLRYAARVLQIAFPFEPRLVDDFMKRLSAAITNAKPQVHGDELFRERVMPQIADLPQVAAHVAIASAFQDAPVKERLYCYEIKINDLARDDAGERILLVGRIAVKSQITMERREFIVAVIHFGGVDLRCSVNDFKDKTKYAAVKNDLLETFSGQSSTDLIRKMDFYFPAKYFRLRDLFVEERRQIIEIVTEKVFEEQARLLETFYEKNKGLAELFVTHEARIPETFMDAARVVLNRTLMRELEKLAVGDFPDQLRAVLEEARSWKIEPDTQEAEKLIRGHILALVERLGKEPANENISAEIIEFLDLGRDLDLSLQLEEAQILFFRIVRSIEQSNEKPPPLFPELAERLAVKLSD